MGYAPHGGFQGRSRPNGEIAWVIHDGLQRPASVAHYPPPAGSGSHVVWVYGYNPAGQLASAWRSNDDFAWTGHYAVERAYGTNGLNQYAYAGPASFSYDPNGNLMWDGGGGRGLIYDVENRLAGTSDGVILRYDPLGRLFQLAVNGAVTTTFLYDGDALVAEYNGAGAMTKRHVHWPGADRPLVTFEGADLSTPRHLIADHQGSIVARTDAAGALVAINAYDEHGIPAATNTGRFQYTGQIWLPELGMYHYKARVYSPYLGRFLQTDPIGYDDQFNLYAYVGNDPVNLIDPSGKDAIVIIRANGDTDVRLPIHFYGDGATPTNIAAITSSIQSASQTLADGRNFQVTVVPITAQDVAEGPAIYNEMEISEGPLAGGINNGHSYMSRDAGNQAHVTMMDVQGQTISSGVGAKGEATGAHYGGHMMGLPDRPNELGTDLLMAPGSGRRIEPGELQTIQQRDPPNTGVRNRIIRCPGSAPECSQ